MAVTSIINIELKDGEWVRFNAQYKAHQELLKKMPSQWGAVGQSIGKAAGVVAKFAAAAKVTADQFKNAATSSDKFVLGLKAADRVVSSLVRGTASMAKNMASVTESILKWGAGIAISGILSLGGIFATFGGLGGSIARNRSAAMQSGNSYGQQKAAEIVYGKRFGEGQITNLMGQIETDIGKGGADMLLRAGLNRSQFAGKSSAEVLPLYLKAIQDRIKRTPSNILTPTLQTLFPNQDLGFLRQVGKENLGSLNAEYQGQSRALGMGMGTQNAWTGFAARMDEVWENAKNKIAEAFAPLLPAMTKLSNSLLTSFGNILKNPQVQAGIMNFGKGLESTAKYLVSPEGQMDMKNFISGVAEAGKALMNLAAWINKEFFDEDLSNRPHVTKQEALAYSKSENVDKSGMSHGGGTQSFNGTSFGHSFTITTNLIAPAGSDLTANSVAGGFAK